MKKYMFVLLFLTTFLTFLSSDIYDDFCTFKVQLYNTQDKTIANSLITEWEMKCAKMKLTEEEKLTLNNFLVLEKISVINGSKKQIYKLLKEQNEKCEKFIKNKKRVLLNKWFLLSFGDIKSRYASYVSWLNAYDESKIARQCYQDALKKDSAFTLCYISNALYLFFAPAIAGGSYEGALKELNTALSCAKNNNEKYLALIFRSQVHYRMEEPKEYQEDLKNASTLVEGEAFTEHILHLNSKENKVFFE